MISNILSVGVAGYIGIVVAVVVVALLIANIKIVPQGKQYIIERLGKYCKTLDAGFHIIVPIIDKVSAKVVLMEQFLDSKPQPVITKDNVTVEIDSVVYFKVFDAERFTYGAVDPVEALDNLTTTTMRNIIGAMSLDETLTSRDAINEKMAQRLDEATNKWGIDVLRVEVSQIILPVDIQTAMEKQMKAEMEKREKILLAEAHQESTVKRAEGDRRAKVLEAEGERDAKIARAEGDSKSLLLRQEAEAMAIKKLKEELSTTEILELKRFEAMREISNGQAAKLIIPTDMVRMANNLVSANELTGIGDTTENAPKKPVQVKSDECCDSTSLNETKTIPLDKGNVK